MLPLRIAVDLLQPSPPIESSLHLMLIPFVQIRHRSMDLAYHPGLGPLPDRSRSRNDYSGHLRHSCRSQERFLNDLFLATRLATVEGPVHGDSLLLNTGVFHGNHIRNHRCDSHQGGHLRNTRCYSHQVSYPLQENGLCTMGVTLFKANGIRIKKVTLSKANRIRFSPLHSDGICFKGVPFSTAIRSHIKRDTLSRTNVIHSKRVTLSKRMGLASRGSPSPKRMRFASDAGPSCGRDPFQGILLQGHAS